MTIQKLFLVSDEAIKSFVRASLYRHEICRRFKFGELGGHYLCIICRHWDSSRSGIVERHVLCAQSLTHFIESAAPTSSSRLQSSTSSRRAAATICPSTLLPLWAPRAAEALALADGNVAVGSHVQYLPTLTAVAA